MFYIFLTLFLRSERELQIFGLSKLNELAESNVLVKQYCAERRWIIKLLLALPKLQDSSVLSTYQMILWKFQGIVENLFAILVWHRADFANF